MTFRKLNDYLLTNYAAQSPMKPSFSILLMIAFVLLSLIISCRQHQEYPMPTNAMAASEVDKDAGAPLINDQVGQIHQACPSDMVEIEGEYCPNLQIKCLFNVDIDGNRKPGPGDLTWACGEYQNPTVCLSKQKISMHFCMDRYEWPNRFGQKPQDWMTYQSAKIATAAIGKRLCTAREWTLAAEGPNMHPVPYGDGYHRNNHICNFDRHYSDVYELPEFKALGLKGIDVFQAKSPNDKMSQALRLFLVPSGSMPDCHSDYGVYDMAGNIDEEVFNEGGTTCLTKSTGNCISGLKGGHVWHVRNASRPMTTVHGETFGWYETSTRGCLDIK